MYEKFQGLLLTVQNKIVEFQFIVMHLFMYTACVFICTGSVS